MKGTKKNKDFQISSRRTKVLLAAVNKGKSLRQSASCHRLCSMTTPLSVGRIHFPDLAVVNDADSIFGGRRQDRVAWQRTWIFFLCINSSVCCMDVSCLKVKAALEWVSKLLPLAVQHPVAKPSGTISSTAKPSLFNCDTRFNAYSPRINLSTPN